MSTPLWERDCFGKASEYRAEVVRITARLTMTHSQWSVLILLDEQGPLPVSTLTVPHAHVDRRAAAFLARRGLVEVIGEVTPRTHRPRNRMARITPDGEALLALVRRLTSEP